MACVQKRTNLRSNPAQVWAAVTCRYQVARSKVLVALDACLLAQDGGLVDHLARVIKKSTTSEAERLLEMLSIA